MGIQRCSREKEIAFMFKERSLLTGGHSFCHDGKPKFFLCAYKNVLHAFPSCYLFSFFWCFSKQLSKLCQIIFVYILKKALELQVGCRCVFLLCFDYERVVIMEL